VFELLSRSFMTVNVLAIAAVEREQGGATIKRRTSQVEGRPVIEVDIRTRAVWLRCASAPHAMEVLVLRPESRYHRLVFTVPEWDAFLADVKAGLYDVVEAT
jgi:hypothetical protein